MFPLQSGHHLLALSLQLGNECKVRIGLCEGNECQKYSLMPFAGPDGILRATWSQGQLIEVVYLVKVLPVRGMDLGLG